MKLLLIVLALAGCASVDAPDVARSGCLDIVPGGEPVFVGENRLAVLVEGERWSIVTLEGNEPCVRAAGAGFWLLPGGGWGEAPVSASSDGALGI